MLIPEVADFAIPEPTANFASIPNQMQVFPHLSALALIFLAVMERQFLVIEVPRTMLMFSANHSEIS